MKFDPRLTVIAAALAAGCAGQPVSNQQLEQARAAVQQAAADPQVQQHAQGELRTAANALHDAERMAREGKDGDLVNHNAYLAEQRARSAMRIAETRRSEASIAAANDERRRMQIEARERETAAAREQARQAETARQEAEARARAMEEERLKKDQQQQQQSTAATELAAEVKRLESELADVRAKQTERGWVLTLKNELLFDTGGATLKDGAQRALNNLTQFLNKYPDRGIAIEGFTDSTGSKEMNQRLSERRAAAVKEALVARGIEARRIDTRGYGPEFPIASNETPTGRQLNRRVEIVINPS
jgi:outer membrane protein OmpA-like peptidoglycan-associated protein